MQEKLKTVLKAWISDILSTTFFRSVLKTYWIFIKYYSIWNSLNWVCPILWPPHAKSSLIGKDPNAGRDWGQEEKGMTEDKMAEWHHRLDGYESEWTPGVGDGQGGLACCNSWGRKESDMTEPLNWTECTKGRPWWLRRYRICLQCRRPGFDPWVGKIPGEGNDYPLQYAGLENPMDRGTWQATVHGVAELNMTEQLTLSIY